jgi:hypothetical protein
MITATRPPFTAPAETVCFLRFRFRQAHRLTRRCSFVRIPLQCEARMQPISSLVQHPVQGSGYLGRKVDRMAFAAVLAIQKI